MFGDGRCCPSDSRHQELFVVPRVCGCILNSRHMALRGNLLFIYFASGNDPGRVLDPLWHSRGRVGRLLIAHWIASCRGYVRCIGLIGRHRTACERQSVIPEIGGYGCFLGCSTVYLHCFRWFEYISTAFPHRN